jgi:hypothetical protein
MKKISIIAGLLILVLMAGCGARGKSKDPEDNTAYTNEELPSENITEEDTSLDSTGDNDSSAPVSPAEEQTDVAANNDTATLDELVAAVQQSKSLTVELTHDANTKIPFPAEDMSYLMNNFTTDNLKPFTYPFLFIPEYCVRSDTGVTFYVMQDDSSEFNITVLQFDGDDTQYTADHSIYEDFVRLLSPSTEMNMAQLHVFSNGPDADSSIDAAVHGYGIYSAALNYFTDSGYALASMMEEDIFKVDDYSITEMSDINPGLVSVSIEYSVKTAYENAPDKWVTGNIFTGALWIDQRGSEYRTYVLGVMPYNEDDGLSQADMTINIYDKSLAKLLNE